MGIDYASARMHVKAMYPRSQKWIDKVMKMSDEQVLAIYMRKQRADAEKPPPEPKPVEEPPEDLTLF